MFISTYSLPYNSSAIPITGYESCQQDFLKLENVPGYTGDDLITSALYSPGSGQLVGYFIASPYCVDCRKRGGTTTKLLFWKN